MDDKQAIRRSRIKLGLLFSVFLIPVIAAYIVHLYPGLMPKSTKNYGKLYKPTVSLHAFQLHVQDNNKDFALKDMQGKWSLIYIGGEQCDKACEETLIKARDARWAQGTEAPRIHYYYLVTADKFTGDMAKLKKEFPGLIMLEGTEAQRGPLIKQFAISASQQPGQDNRLYLVDPAGVLLMHYPYGFRHIGLMEDLKFLLKWSQIG